MALAVRLQITAGDHLQDIETLEVRRLTRLHGRNPKDQRHDYVAKRYGPDRDVRATAEFTHVYGDGAWWCVLRALMALGSWDRAVGERLNSTLGEADDDLDDDRRDQLLRELHHFETEQELARLTAENDQLRAQLARLQTAREGI